MTNLQTKWFEELFNSISKALLIGCYIFTIQIHAIALENFSRHLEYYNIRISPDGKHLAALVNADGGKKLVFLDSKIYQVTYALNSGRKSQLADWALFIIKVVI